MTWQAPIICPCLKALASGDEPSSEVTVSLPEKKA
jgi:hypothetical protein